MSAATSQHKLADAKAHFSELVQKAMPGESVIVTKENRPVVRIVAITSSSTRTLFWGGARTPPNSPGRLSR